MEVIRDLSRSDRVVGPSVVTIGNFDGVHRGHQSLFARVREEAARLQVPSVVYTFDPHPQRILAPEKAPEVLTALPKRVRLIRETGIDVLVCEHFTLDFARQEPEDFLRDVLIDRLAAKKVVVGYDFCFGRKGRGTPDFLRTEAPKHGIEAEVFPAVILDEEIVSSTRVRACLRAGDVELAARLLGRFYYIQGHVISGHKRGRGLGFPTANLAQPDELLPACGVYATFVDLGDAIWPAVTNVGRRPTFGAEEINVEVHLLDFDGDLYGRTIGVRFVERIRDEATFSGLAALVEQIQRDVARGREILAATEAPKPGGMLR